MVLPGPPALRRLTLSQQPLPQQSAAGLEGWSLLTARHEWCPRLPEEGLVLVGHRRRLPGGIAFELSCVGVEELREQSRAFLVHKQRGLNDARCDRGW